MELQQGAETNDRAQDGHLLRLGLRLVVELIRIFRIVPRVESFKLLIVLKVAELIISFCLFTSYTYKT